MKYHKNQHVCGENYCKVCKDFFQEDHRCYMQPTDSEKSDNQRQATLKSFSTSSVHKIYYCNVLKVSNLELIQNASTVKHHGVDRSSTNQTSVWHRERVKNA